ncbi:TPA: hypothetical protein HMT81_21235 [Escherichia coli]|nr:hypothetical protein [Escherichia coli]
MRCRGLIALLVWGQSVAAADLGTWGDLWPVKEPDMLTVIMQRLTVLEQSGEMGRKMDAFKERVIRNSLRPPAVPGIGRTEKYGSRLFDPSVRLAADTRMLKKDGKDSDIRIGDLPIIRDSEIQNFCLHGTVGAGKSEVIRRLANYARQRGDMVVIYDRSGEFVKSYYDPSIDKILNPLDARCAAWDLWKECLTQPDFDNTANTLIPMGTKEDPFWQGSGRTIFAEAAYLMRNDPKRAEHCHRRCRGRV